MPVAWAFRLKSFKCLNPKLQTENKQRSFIAHMLPTDALGCGTESSGPKLMLMMLIAKKREFS